MMNTRFLSLVMVIAVECAGCSSISLGNAAPGHAVTLAPAESTERPRPASSAQRLLSGEAAVPEPPARASNLPVATSSDATYKMSQGVPVTGTRNSTGAWEISPSDKTLQSAISHWSATSGWQMSWELPVDYEIVARTSISGTFEEALETVAISMEQAQFPMKVIFYNGNRVVRIVMKGVE